MRTIVILGMAFFLMACGQSGPKRVKVTGEVTFDGTPVEEGNILFLPADTDAGGDGGRIAGGKYAVEVQPGAKRVRITADRRVPGKVDKLGMPMNEQYIPSRYNTATTLTLTIEESQKKDFELMAK